MANASNTPKAQLIQVKFDLETFYMVGLSTDQVVSLSTLKDEDCELYYRLVFAVLSTPDQNINWNNIGTLEIETQRFYAGSICKNDTEDESDLVINFGKNDGRSNKFPLFFDDNGKLSVGNAKPVFTTQKEKRQLKDKPGLVDVDIAYLTFSETITYKEKKYSVNFSLPFNVKELSLTSAKEIQQAILNQDTEEVKELLNTPYKGGGGWAAIHAVVYPYIAANLELPTMCFQIEDAEYIISTNEYGDSIDLVLADGHQIPYTISHKGFKVTNAQRIRVPASTPAFKVLKAMMNGNVLKAKLKNGLYLMITGFNAKNKLHYPQHRLVEGFCDPYIHPDFSELLESSNEKSSNVEKITQAKPALEASNASEFAVTVPAETVEEVPQTAEAIKDKLKSMTF